MRSKHIAALTGAVALAAAVVFLVAPTSQAFADPTPRVAATWSTIDIEWSSRLRLRARHLGAEIELSAENFVLAPDHRMAEPDDVTRVPVAGFCQLNGTERAVTTSADGSIRVRLPAQSLTTDFDLLFQVYDDQGTEIGHWGAEVVFQ